MKKKNYNIKFALQNYVKIDHVTTCLYNFLKRFLRILFEKISANNNWWALSITKSVKKCDKTRDDREWGINK